jgi:transcriptional regulator with XRE-family HTH domain
LSARVSPQRARLGGRLRALRAATGLSGNRFAAQIGWLQSRVSKLETGAQMPTEDDLARWVAATGASPDELTQLRELLTAARVEYATWRDVAQRGNGAGLAERQAEYARSEASATYIAEYQPGLVPGLVQTAAYARELLALPGGPGSAGGTAADIEALVGERIKRQNVLYEPGRTIDLVIGEAALHTAPGSAATMAGQLDRLVAVSQLSTVRLAILPFGAGMPVIPLCGFAIEDDVVSIETLTGEQTLHDPAETGVYRDAFERLLHASDRGDAAVRHLRRAQEMFAP